MRPTTVLHYPSRRELVEELGRGYDVVGISFVLSTFHRMKEVVALVRKHSPSSKIVLGGYGTVLSDEVLRPYADHICREEGAGFMRRLLGEPAAEPPLKHPLVVSRLRLFGREVSRTGMVFAGLGCPNGCDFCCTSHFFKRKHIRLLPTGRDIYRVIERYHEIEPGMSIAILDEDFLLNRVRAMEFRDCVREGERPLSIFAFASVKAISQYSVTEILEMGIDGLWIGYEGSRSGYAKQSGRPVEELFRELRDHGISVLSSMIVGLPYQTPEILEKELSDLLDLQPTLAQFLIYGPTPGTPFFEKVEKEGLFHREIAEDPEAYYRRCTGFCLAGEAPADERGRDRGDPGALLPGGPPAAGSVDLSLARDLGPRLRGAQRLRQLAPQEEGRRRSPGRFGKPTRSSWPGGCWPRGGTSDAGSGSSRRGSTVRWGRRPFPSVCDPVWLSRLPRGPA